MFTRPIIDSLDFALKGREISGEVPMAELPRMADLLADQEGKISYVISGYEDKEGTPLLQLTLDGTCNLRCQRCMKAMNYPIRLVSKLKLVSEDGDGSSDIEDDEADSIPAEKRLDVLALLEEELLLSLPIAPKHEEGECRMADSGLEKSTNPFAILASLKK